MHAPAQRLSYWQEEAAAAPLPAAEPPSLSDIAIVGGGLAGLSTAIAILQRQPHARVTVLEARFAGFGASGRNGGLMSPLPAPVWLLSAHANSEHAWALRTMNAKVHALGAWLAQAVPESQAAPTTLRLQAMGPITASGLSRVSATLSRAGVSYDMVSEGARGGKPSMELPTYSVHPYRLVRALAAYASSLGAVICENTSVETLEAANGGARIGLAGGREIHARRVVVSTNAYTASIKASSVPRAKIVRNYMLATAPLDGDVVRRLGGASTFFVELNKAYAFYRLHGDRLVYGGVETFFSTPKSDYEVPAAVAKELRSLLAKSVPWHPNLPVAAEWGGAFHNTVTDLPIIRRSSATGSIVFNVGYGGTGVALTQIFAKHAAAMALDLTLPEEDARLESIARATHLPIGGLLRLGALVAWDVVKSVAGR